MLRYGQFEKIKSNYHVTVIDSIGTHASTLDIGSSIVHAAYTLIFNTWFTPYSMLGIIFLTYC